MKTHTISFQHAWAGLLHALLTQPNFIIHLGLSLLVVIAALLTHITALYWLILALTITIGLVIELLNTAIESTVDLATSDFHPLAKIAKDTAAAAMLVYAVGAVVIALIIFIPQL